MTKNGFIKKEISRALAKFTLEYALRAVGRWKGVVMTQLTLNMGHAISGTGV